MSARESSSNRARVDQERDRLHRQDQNGTHSLLHPLHRLTLRSPIPPHPAQVLSPRLQPPLHRSLAQSPAPNTLIRPLSPHPHPHDPLDFPLLLHLLLLHNLLERDRPPAKLVRPQAAGMVDEIHPDPGYAGSGAFGSGVGSEPGGDDRAAGR